MASQVIQLYHSRQFEGYLARFAGSPYQGLAIPGLSPNEFARRIWLF